MDARKMETKKCTASPILFFARHFGIMEKDALTVKRH